MASLQCEIHALTTKEEVQVRDTDFSAFKYQEKSSRSETGRPYAEDKATFASGRGKVLRLDNKRPARLRSSLRELEDALGEQGVTWSRWRSPRLLQIILTSGLIASVWFTRLGDLERIVLDKWLVGKLGDHVTDLQFTGKVLAITYLEAKLTIVTFGKQGQGGELLASLDPRLATVELPGPPGRRLDRRLEVGADSSGLVVWWSTGGQEVFPWAPSLREEDRANLVLVNLKEPGVTACSRTGGEPLYCRLLQDTIHCLAQAQAGGARRGETQLENSILALEHGKHLRRKVTRTVTISNVVICHALVPQSDNVLLGTVDGAIFTFDQVENRVDNQVKAGFTAASLACHPDGAIFLALSEKGLVQCFDTALTPIQLCFPNEEQVTSNVLDLTGYFRSPVSLRGGCWAPSSSPATTSSTDTTMAFNFFLLRWQDGPLALLRLNAGVYTGGRMGPLQIVGQYLKLHLYHQVLLFLSQLSWTYSGHTLILCLSTAFNAFIKLPYTREKECLLEMCLGVFHTPSRPICEEAREEHGEAVRDLTRRFFHHLVRHNQLVKGFQLAVDINDYDLFMDIHHVAVRRGVPDLAHAALIKAKAAYSRLDSDSGSRSGSRQSAPVPSPLALLAGEVEQEPGHLAALEAREVADTMQPGRTATFLRTTAAKKISTNQFRQAELEDAMIASKSLKYESIVSLPQHTLLPPPFHPPGLASHAPALPTSQPPALPSSHPPPLPSSHPPGLPPSHPSTMPSSPYVFRATPPDQAFVTSFSTEGEYRVQGAAREHHQQGEAVAALSRDLEQTHLRAPLYQAPPGAYHLAPPPSLPYQPSPPSYQPPPSLPRQQQQEDIKVIHFGVV